MDVERCFILGNIDRKCAGGQRDEIGKQRDLEIRRQPERIGEDTGLHIELRPRHHHRHLPGRQRQLLEEQQQQRQHADRTQSMTAALGDLVTDKAQSQRRDDEAEENVRRRDAATYGEPYANEEQ